MDNTQACSARQRNYLECEKVWVFVLLMFVGGFLGAFTYSVRGGVFCNAQTSNFVLLAMAIGNKNWSRALYLLVPITAYFLGAVISESIAGPIKRLRLIRWDTLFIMVEIAVIAVLGLIPENAPYQITQVIVNFICSMQYNTFRQAQGIPMATTFCTNHIRQVGVFFSKTVRHHERSAFKRMCMHILMLGAFVIGGAVSTVLCCKFLGRAVWGALVPLAIVLVGLIRADQMQQGHLEQVPRGH